MELFTGGRLAVLDDDIWTLNGSSHVEHRTGMSDGTLRFDGEAPSPGVGFLFDPYVEHGSITHAVNFDAPPSGWITFAIDAGVWDVVRTEATLPNGRSGPTSFVPEPGVGFFSSNLCVAEPGCQPPLVCPPVERCPAVTFDINSIGKHAVYRALAGLEIELIATARPLVPGLTPTILRLDAPLGSRMIVSIRNPGLELPVVQIDQRLVFPVLTDAGITLSAFEARGQLISATDSWVISTDPSDVFSVFFTPTPVTYR
ncbi:MAG: hypothetical protein QM817_17560 [Archangium sp.]